jgi:hypothetical protein
MFSARHSFNSILSGCAGNITTSSAYEPGSGSTIMSYFGLCGLDNLSGSTGNYFHTNSLEQIITFSNTAPTCFSSSASNNIAPLVVANPSGNPIVIPKGTPFTLEGSGSDADGEVVYYTWEQFDLGTTRGGANAAENSTDSPIFRSYDPSPEGKVRTFPYMATIANNGVSNLDEALPLVARTLKMRLTGRDFNATAGGTHSDQITITVNSTGPFEVSSHNTSSTIAAGATFPVTWNKNGTEALSANVKISLSIDGGQSFPFVILASTPNDQSQSITIPANVPATSMARIKVSSVGTANYEWFDINNADLTITSSCAAVSSFLCPATPISGNASDAAFNLGSLGFVGSELPNKSLSVSFAAQSSRTIIKRNTDADASCASLGSYNSEIIAFQVSETGSYQLTDPSVDYGMTILSSSTVSCASFVGSNIYNSYQWTNVLNVTLQSCTTYYLVLYQ